MRPEPAVLIRNLSFRYPRTVSGRSVTALRDVNLQIDPGELVVITGPSGSGKSSLSRCFNGLIPHATKGVMGGDILVNGMNTRDYEVHEFSAHVGLVFQDPDYQLITGNVTNEIAFGLETLGLTPEEIERGIFKITDTLGIRHLIGRPINHLSWGERQRVAIASVLAMRPSVLVMDEPFSGIDASAAQALCEAIEKIRNELNTTVIIFEHRISLLRGVAERIVVLTDGKVSFDGPLFGWSPPHPETSLFSEGRGDCSVDTVHWENLPGDSGDSPSPPVDAGISFRDVHFRYPGSSGETLDGITLDLGKGEITVLTGHNGSGKTTLLKLCNGLLKPDSGEVLVHGIPVGKRSVSSLSGTVGLLCQHADFQIFESTITDELSFGPRNIRISEDHITGRLATVSRECSLDHIDPATPPLGLSGGEKQRVVIAGLFMMDTPVVVLDEPTFGLDFGLKQALAASLIRMRTGGKRLLLRRTTRNLPTFVLTVFSGSGKDILGMISG